MAPLFLIACDQTYVPRTPRHNSSGDVALRLGWINRHVHSMKISSGIWSGTALYAFGLSAHPSTTLVAVSLTSPGARPCRRGVDANAVAIDDRWVVLKGPVPVSGAHRFVASFERWAQRSEEAQAIDFEFSTPSGELCERVDVTEKD